jgi:hypothetical protein
MAAPSDVDLVYLDLRDSVTAFNAVRGSPRDIRRSLSHYVELSQRLTSAMRKDYSRRGKGKWEASLFSEWTPGTELLKYLRNQDQHENQVFVTVHEQLYYDIPEDMEIKGIPSRNLILDSKWQMTDQTLDRPPAGSELSLTEPENPLQPGVVLLPTKTESSYVLYPRNPEDEKKMAASGVTDLHRFVNSTFVTLEKYYQYYNKAINEI